MQDEENVESYPTGEIDVEPRVPPLPKNDAKKIWTFAIQSSPMSESHREMLCARAIDPDQLKVPYGSATASLWRQLVQEFGLDKVEAAGLTYHRDDGTYHPRTCIQPGRLLIAYPGNQKLVPYFAGYARCPEQRASEDAEAYEHRRESWAKCCGPKGYSSQVYGVIPKGSPLLIITEGQLKAEAARQAGFHCIGLPGIGAKPGPVATQCRNHEVRRAVILFDSQAESQEIVDLQADNLARELLKAQIPTYRAILPLEGEKSDIDSFLAAHGPTAFEDVLREAAGRPYRFQETDGE
jgi:hypothetical protein